MDHASEQSGGCGGGVSVSRTYNFEDLRKLGLSFLEKTNRAQSTNADTTRSDYPELIGSIEEIIGCFTSLNISAQTRGYDADHPSAKERMFIVAQFAANIEGANRSLLGGQYNIAANILKQQLELVTAFDEVKQGKRKEGKTPNVGNVLPKFKNLYRRLNELAHPAKSDIVEALSNYEDGKKYGPTSYPIYRTQSAYGLLCAHLHILLQMIVRKEQLFKECFGFEMNAFEENAIKEALDVLHAHNQVAN